MNKTKSNHILPIAIMFALFFMISFVTGLQNPMAIIVKNQFQASNFLSQLGNFANFLAYAFMGIPAGIILKKKGYRFTALSAVTVGFIGVGISVLSGFIYNEAADNGTLTFAVYIIGALISGFSMCMLNTVVNPMLNTLGGGGNTGNKLLQFGGATNSIGATIIPVLVAYLIGDVANANLSNARPALYIAGAIFALAFITLYFYRIPEPHILSKEELIEDKKNGSIKQLFKFRHYLLGTIAIFVYVGVENGIPNMANLLMTSKVAEGGLAMNTTVAGGIVGTYWFLMLIGRLIGGSLGTKISSKSMLSAVSGLGIALVVGAILSAQFAPDVTVKMPVFNADISFSLDSVPLYIMLLTLCGFSTSVMWGGIYNLAVEGLGKLTPAASGFFMVMVCGGGILPLIAGKVADLSNFMSSYWVIVVGLAYILFYALIGSKKSKNQQ